MEQTADGAVGLQLRHGGVEGFLLLEVWRAALEQVHVPLDLALHEPGGRHQLWGRNQRETEHYHHGSQKREVAGGPETEREEQNEIMGLFWFHSN